MSDDLFARKVAGKVVTVYCRSCKTAIHVDGTRGRAEIVRRNEDLPTMPSISEPPLIEANGVAPSADAPTPSAPAKAATVPRPRGSDTSTPPPLPKRAQEPSKAPADSLAGTRSQALEDADEPPVWVISGKDDVDHELSEREIRAALGRGDFDAEAIAWREGMDDWLPVGGIPELAPYLKSAQAGRSMSPPPKPRPLGMSAPVGLGSMKPTMRPPGGGLEPASVVAVGDVRLPPSSAHAAMEALLGTAAEEGAARLPPSSAGAAEQALAETLPDDEVASVHGEALAPPMSGAEAEAAPRVVAAPLIPISGAPIETLADDEVASVHDPGALADLEGYEGSLGADRQEAPLALAREAPSPHGSDPFVLVDLSDVAKEKAATSGRVAALGGEAPISSVPGDRHPRSRAMLWTLAALGTGLAGGWFLLSPRPPATSGAPNLEVDLDRPKRPVSAPERHAATPTPFPADSQELAEPALDAKEPLAAKQQTQKPAPPSGSNADRPKVAQPRSPGRGETKPPESEPERSPEPAGAKKPQKPTAPEPQAPESAEPDQEDKEKAPPPLDRMALQTALAAAAAQAGGCRKDPDPPGTAVVTVIIAPSGRVTSASVNGPPYAGTKTGGCVALRMREVRVPAFSGSHETVRKTVVVR